MYCSGCGSPVAPGLSFCNRCGTSLKERASSSKSPINAMLTAITLIGIVGLGIMLGGSLTLRNDAHMEEGTIILFMSLTFLVVVITEVLLVRQLSRLTGVVEKTENASLHQPGQPNELRGPQPRTLSEAMPSVTESTTRTLEYSRKEPVR